MGVIKPDRCELFAINLAKGMQQGEAYADAGYKPNDAGASRLANSVKIINRVAELRNRMVNKVVLSKHYVLEATIENVEKALGRKPVKVSRRVRQGDEWVTETEDVYLYKGDVANQALKMLGSEFGLYTERKDVRITNEFAGLSDAELAQRLVEVGQQMLLGAPPDGVVIDHEDAEGDGGDD